MTPPPQYGKRVYERDTETLDAEDWAQAVLEDRQGPALHWRIQEIYPLTAVSVEAWASIEAVELLTISYPQADPAITATVKVVGGEILITPKAGDAAVWAFAFETAQTAPVPLAVDGADPVEFLYHEDGITLLYPDGTV